MSKKATKASLNDAKIAYDLLDTIKANRRRCVGMAANMIGENVAIIVIEFGNTYLTMFNPVILKTSNEYRTYEGCLCYAQEKPCVRHQTIEVKYYDMAFKCHKEKFSGKTAQIIEHEMDHLNGILI